MDFFCGFTRYRVQTPESVFYGTTRGIFRALSLGTQPSWLSYLACLLKLP